jgi:hypothetical protein
MNSELDLNWILNWTWTPTSYLDSFLYCTIAGLSSHLCYENELPQIISCTMAYPILPSYYFSSNQIRRNQAGYYTFLEHYQLIEFDHCMKFRIDIYIFDDHNILSSLEQSRPRLCDIAR